MGEKSVEEHDFAEPGNPFNPAVDTTLAADPYYVMDLSIFAEDVLDTGTDVNLVVNNVLDREYFDAGRDVLFGQPGLSVTGLVRRTF